MGVFDSVKKYFLKQGPAAARLSFSRFSAPEYSGISLESMVRAGWRKNELIHACISKTARTASQIELKIYDKKSGDELPEHPLKQLIQRPNPEMSEYDFWYVIILYTLLSGRMFFEKERDRKGRVIALWPLRPDWVKYKMKNPFQIDKYLYQPPGEPTPLEYEPWEMLRFKVWDPEGFFSTWPPAAVAARQGDVDNDTTDMLKSFFQDGGAPIGVLKTEQQLRDDAVEELRKRWRQRYGGWKNWLDPAVLDKGAEYQRIGLTFKEMGFAELDSRTEARICMCFDLPPILIGAKVGLDRATYANYSEARRAWWEDSLMPRYTDLNDVIVNKLLPEFTMNTQPVKIEWDTSRVPALQEERTARWNRAGVAIRTGGITVNEYRAELGLADIGMAGDIFLRSPVQMAVSLNDLAAPATPQPTDEDGEPDEDFLEEEGAEDGNIKSIIASEYKEPATEERREWEKRLTREMIDYFKGQTNRIKDALDEELTL